MMNDKFIEKFDLITKKNEELTEIEDELNKLDRELLQIVTDIFRDDGILEGSWNVSMDMVNIVFVPKKLKHKKLLDEYRKYINKTAYVSKLEFWTSTGDPVTVSFLDSYRMKLCLLNMDPENVSKFLEDYKISVKKFVPLSLGVNVVKVSDIRDRLLKVVGK